MGIPRFLNFRLREWFSVVAVIAIVGGAAWAQAPQAQVSPRPYPSVRPSPRPFNRTKTKKKAPPAPNEPTLAARTEFMAACEHAYVLSSGNSANVVSAGHILCRCASLESMVQGVTTPGMLAEAAKIRQNPKYQIHDPHLLDALRICLIEAYRENGAKPPVAPKTRK